MTVNPLTIIAKTAQNRDTDSPHEPYSKELTETDSHGPENTETAEKPETLLVLTRLQKMRLRFERTEGERDTVVTKPKMTIKRKLVLNV